MPMQPNVNVNGSPGGIMIATHDANIASHFVTDGVAHGTAALTRQTADDTTGSNPTTGATGDSGSTSTTSPTTSPANSVTSPWTLITGGPGNNGSIFVPTPGSGYNADTYGPNPSFIINPDGSVTFNGNSGDPTEAQTGSSLSAAENEWLQKFGGIFGANGSGASGTGASPTTPFTQLASLLGNLSTQTPSVSIPDDSTAATSVPTTSTNSTGAIVAIVLLAAAGYAVYYWYKHRHHSAPAE